MSKEPNLRKRVQEIQESDPLFFEQMLEWKDEFARRRKLWLDKPAKERKLNLVTNRIVKVPFTIDDACKMMWEAYMDDEDWGLVPA